MRGLVAVLLVAWLVSLLSSAAAVGVLLGAFTWWVLRAYARTLRKSTSVRK